MRFDKLEGKVNIIAFHKSDDLLAFYWKNLESRTETGDKNIVLDNQNTYNTIPEFESNSIELICWNKKTNMEVGFPQLPEDFLSGRIIADDLSVKLKDFFKHANNMEIYWIIRLVQDNTTKHYILGGDDENNEMFAEQDIWANEDSKDSLNPCLVPRYIKQGEWVFETINGKRYLENLHDRGLVEKKYLDVEKIEIEDNAVQIVLEKDSAVPTEHIQDYLLYVEAYGCLFHGKLEFHIEKNVLVFSSKFVEQLKKLYNWHNKLFHFRLFCMFFEGQNHTYYEFRTKKKFPKDTKYDKYARYESYVDIDDADKGAIAAVAYYTAGGYLSFMLKKRFDVFNEFCKAHIYFAKMFDNKLKIFFSLLKTPYSLKSVSLILRNKSIKRQYDFKLSVRECGNRLWVEGILPFDEVEWEQFYWDIRGLVTKDGADFELRLKNYNKIHRAGTMIVNQQKTIEAGKCVVYPYITKSYDYAVMYRRKTEQDNMGFVCKEYLALILYYLLRPYWLRKKVWLVYEKYSLTAQDNSFYFFKYCMDQLSAEENKNIYYVIDKSSPDYQYVRQYGKKVIQFLSLKHMIYLKAARLLVSSDTKAHAYAWHSPNTIYRYMVKYNRNVFLQHGVIYYKKCHQGLGKHGTNSCRLFIVSSEVERDIIEKYFGYNKNEIAVTGLARWDVLKSSTQTGEKIILMMPTWRSWLEEVTEDKFKQSDYYNNYMKLLNYQPLHDFLEQSKTRMIFYIHPKFREYINTFTTDCSWIELIEFGSQPLNELLMKCNMMVTDYSSACWDVYYQEKPVLFYMFDYEMYNQVQGSYVDMRTDAFGEATSSLEELVCLLKEYEMNNFKEKERYAQMRKDLLPYRDDQNSKRTYDAIKKKFH